MGEEKLTLPLCTSLDSQTMRILLTVDVDAHLKLPFSDVLWKLEPCQKVLKPVHIYGKNCTR